MGFKKIDEEKFINGGRGEENILNEIKEEKIKEGENRVYTTFTMRADVLRRLNKYTKDKEIIKSRLVNNILDSFLMAKGY